VRRRVLRAYERPEVEGILAKGRSAADPHQSQSLPEAPISASRKPIWEGSPVS